MKNIVMGLLALIHTAALLAVPLVTAVLLVMETQQQPSFLAALGGLVVLLASVGVFLLGLHYLHEIGRVIREDEARKEAAKKGVTA